MPEMNKPPNVDPLRPLSFHRSHVWYAWLLYLFLKYYSHIDSKCLETNFEFTTVLDIQIDVYIQRLFPLVQFYTCICRSCIHGVKAIILQRSNKLVGKGIIYKYKPLFSIISHTFHFPLASFSINMPTFMKRNHVFNYEIVYSITEGDNCATGVLFYILSLFLIVA